MAPDSLHRLNGERTNPTMQSTNPAIRHLSRQGKGREARERAHLYVYSGRAAVFPRPPLPRPAPTACSGGAQAARVWSSTRGEAGRGSAGEAAAAQVARVWWSTRGAAGRGSAGEAAAAATGMGLSCHSVDEDVHRRQGAHRGGPCVALRSRPGASSPR